MRVVEVRRFGGPEVLTVVVAPDPVPEAGEVVVDVHAADVLWVETAIRRGQGGGYFPVRPPYRPGVGVAGTVSGVGAGVDPAWIGRRVVTRTGEHGGYVERARVPVAGLIPVPDAVASTAAAALLHDGVTALGLMDAVPVETGDGVLVTASGGGLGSLLVQLARAAGAHVVAAARGARKLELLRGLGAATVVDYATAGWTDAVEPVQVVFDGAGGAYGRAAFGVLADKGHFSAHGTPAGSFTSVDEHEAAVRGITVTGIDRVQFGPEQARAYAARALAEAAAGRITPVIGQTWPLDRAADAHAAIEARAVVGKTLLIANRGDGVAES